MATNLSTSPIKSPDEWRLRRELADFYHMVDYLGWTELIFNHISVRLPGPAHHYLVNPFGLNYGEITPENLLKVSLEAELIEPSEYRANPAGFALHGAIHGHRPDVACVAHTHTTAVSAVAMKHRGFDHNNFYGAQLTGRVAYHDFEGITIYQDERARMLASLGDKHVLVLRNHGVAVCERDIPTTFALLWTVQRAAEVQCRSAELPGEDIELTEEVRQRCRGNAGDLGAAHVRCDGAPHESFRPVSESPAPAGSALRLDISIEGLPSAARRGGAPGLIMTLDARQHGCDRQGIASVKVARNDARAFSPPRPQPCALARPIVIR